MLPESAQRMSSSEGSGLSFKSATLVSIMPGVQNPHWSPCSCLNAAWIGCRAPPAIRLNSQHRAGLYGRSVDQHRTGAAVGRVTSDVRPGESEFFPEEVHEQQPRLDLRIGFLAVDGDGDRLAHVHPPPRARSEARFNPRSVKTRTRLRLYSTEPRWSAFGSAASAARAAACLMAASSSRTPLSDASAFSALMFCGPTAVSPMPADPTLPSSMRRCTATATVAKSPTLRSSFR